MTAAGGGGGWWRRGAVVAAVAAATFVAAAQGAPVWAQAPAGAGAAGGAADAPDALNDALNAALNDAVAVDVADLPPLPAVDEDVAKATALLAAAGVGEDLVTGAAKREQSLGNVASAVTVISGDRLRRMGARTVGEAIAGAAGIYLADDRLSTRVGIRGLQLAGDFNTRILVIIDGTSVTESWSHLSGVGYDLPISIDEVERIEVIRGPVSSIYGTNAFFGIINIITRGPQDTSRTWARATAATIGGGSLAAGFALGSLDRQLRGSISATMRRGEQLDYRYFESSDDGPIEMTAHQDRGMDAGRQVQFALAAAYRGTFAQVRGYLFKRTIPFAPYGSDFDDPYHQTNRQLLVDVGHALEVQGLQLSARAFGNFYQFDDYSSDPSGETSPLIIVGIARTLGSELRARYQPLDWLGATAGFEGAYAHTDSEYYTVEDPKRRDGGELPALLAGLYAEADAAPTRWLGLTAGVRVDYHGEFDRGVSPRLAAFLSRSEHYGLKLLYAQGFRYPSTYEAVFTDNEDFIGHSKEELGKINPEDIKSFEAIAWARPTPTTWLRASGFYWDANGIIKQGVVVDGEPGEEKKVLQFNNGDSYTSLGLELEASYRDRSGWLAFAGAALTRVRLTELDPETKESTDAGRPPGSPWFTASLGVSSPKLRNLAHLSSELMVIGSEPTRGEPMEGRSATFVGWNVAIYAPSLYGFDLTIGARNLLGTAQEVPAAEDFDRETIAGVVPGEGRELYVRLGHALP